MTKVKCKNSNCGKRVVAKGFCDTCYRRFKKYGNVERTKIASLPGELWAEIHGCPQFFISTKGRVKSLRARFTEKLIKVKFSPADGKNNCLHFRDRKAGGKVFRIHLEVLRAFVPNPDMDTRAIFKDGDIKNCDVENLEWLGAGYLVPQAILMAEKSKDKQAGSFIKFWNGEKNALDWLWEAANSRVAGFLNKRAFMFNMGWIDIEEMTQETVMRGFCVLRRGMIFDLGSVYSLFISIAKNVFAGYGRKHGQMPCFSENVYMSDSSVSGCMFDLVGFASPSAELVALYREFCDHT